ncbi:hypothetical protein N0M98_25325 [Paenibacillus doosanensis]|uniref:hypothetical protein n=1 Tax=Paenibacillus doosanensis TaxID=1229154 RepID=UPI00217FB7D9|nr:hypothetical protein [Paenibacillus doosanensis]MCS7463432.1 hypothetical protein [Paenibacillus doosanensis]
MLSFYRKFSIYIALVAMTGIALFLTGCTDNKQLKQDLLQAAAKQQEIVNYRFQGSVELKADAALFGQTSPMTATLFALLKDSQIDYKGVAALEPPRMEADLSVTPAGGTAIDIPVLIKDSKLYFHMPPLNKQDEYMTLPIAPPKDQASGSDASGALKNTGRLTAEITKQLLSGADPDWLQTTKEAVTLQDGSPGKQIALSVTPKNEQAVADYLNQSVLPSLSAQLKTNGLASDAWSSALGAIRLRAPSSIEMRIDSDGFIREQKWDLVFTSGGSANEHHLIWTHALSDINRNPAFAREVPAKQKSLEELLLFLKPAGAAQK